jgi:hypothetical protein
VTAESASHDTFEEKVSDQPFQPTWRSARIGAFVASRLVTTLPVQNGRNWEYESTSAMSGYNEAAEYLFEVSLASQGFTAGSVLY